MSKLGERTKNAWNAFLGRDAPVCQGRYGSEVISGSRRGYHTFTTNWNSMVNFIYNRISVDCSMININHVRLDDEGNFESIIDDGLNGVFTRSANIDQTGRKFIQDIVFSMLDEGCIAVIPVETTSNPFNTDSFDVLNARVGKIMKWYPKHVDCEVYNEDTGKKERVVAEKRFCLILENPFYEIMNEPNSIAQRLKRTLSQLDDVNEQTSSNKLNLLFQLPYSIKTSSQKRIAEERRETLESQLTKSSYGIGYIDSSEKIIQLNRSIDNNLWEQSKDLIDQLFNQMGITKSIFDGTADEKTQLNYYNRTIDPIIVTITEEAERKWISKTARTQLQAMRYYRDPFKLVPAAQLAEIADKFTRNEIVSSNEFRSVIGYKPSKDPKADMLINSNLNHPEEDEERENAEINYEEKEE